jgi:hypothetical protein
LRLFGVVSIAAVVVNAAGHRVLETFIGLAVGSIAATQPAPRRTASRRADRLPIA